ncbi:hypothetical protein [Sporichthya polymorpha]|uniref:hypothetical protein n=1 Tax=Sporichthya polymorpha TaxID=35751 RepID=UPI00037A02AE|nr:hypothetical protein [Sporichthya polymorpha]
MELKIGQRLRSQVDETEVVVVRAPAGSIELTCGGHPMIDQAAAPADGLNLVEGEASGVHLGKRYADAAQTVELLVTKAGRGSLSLNGEVLEPKVAKPLPASD